MPVIMNAPRHANHVINTAGECLFRKLKNMDCGAGRHANPDIRVQGFNVLLDLWAKREHNI
jgi:hypothetical protein